jgi:anti-anti-sigma factor
MAGSTTTTRVVGQVVIIDLQGEAWLRGGEDVLVPLIVSLVQEGYLKFVVSLAHTPTMDSLALSQIVRAYCTLVRRGASLRLCCMSLAVRRLLDVTRLATVLETYPSEEAALAAPWS